VSISFTTFIARINTHTIIHTNDSAFLDCIILIRGDFVYTILYKE